MHQRLQSILTTLATCFISTVVILPNAVAVQFDKTEVEQERFIAMAVPRAFGYSLIVLEQISDIQACWSEQGASPTMIDPLLVNFDFTGICGRATDSNGYSVRIGEQDLSLSHSLTVRSVDDEIFLVATSHNDVETPPIVIGRSYGITNGFTKIILEPGWRFTKRSYQGKTLGHIYFTYDQLPN
ncbi:MAG: DUF3747 domain-containing protein [Microcoleaceae cyanobacterium]